MENDTDSAYPFDENANPILRKSIFEYLTKKGFGKSEREYIRAKNDLKNIEGSRHYERCIRYISEWMGR